MNTLKPCPFCPDGGDLQLVTFTDGVDDVVHCHTCDRILKHKIWQTRPIEDDLRKRIAELEAEIDQLTARLRQERQDDKWIPVSERLPDNWKSVLTIDISKSTRDMVTAFYNPETSLWSTHFSCDLWVTHWMPLPESPIMYGKVCEE
jgi:hypothetical protein